MKDNKNYFLKSFLITEIVENYLKRRKYRAQKKSSK